MGYYCAKCEEYFSSPYYCIHFYHPWAPSLGRQMITQDDLENWFVYHSPSPEQIPHYQAVRDAGRNLATAILEHTPTSADQSAAIRHVREAVMTANAAIACDGK